MPKSKRAKVVHLSKTEKKGKELSEKIFNGVREAAEQYQYIFVFSVDNMRNTHLKDVRTEFSDSRIFFGKTKVMAKALGTDAASETLPKVGGLSKYLNGSVGLLFTSREPTDVIDYFASYSNVDFARAGVASTRTFTVPAGIVHSRGGEVPEADDVPLPHSIEVQLRGWGMPTRLVKGKVTLDDDHTICREGEILNAHQTALLKTFGVALAEFRVRLQAYYSAANQEVKEVADEMEE